MPISLRHNQIRKRLRKAGSVSVAVLAKDLGVSEMTIRRDLAALEKKGLAVRTFGGALAPDDRPMEFSFGDRMKVESARKEAIGRKAAETVKEGETVLIDTGTTALCVARALKHFENLTVVTGSLPVAWELRGTPGIETILLGGRVRRTSQDIYGPLAEMNLEHIRVYRAFLGADGVDAEGGFTTESLEVARISGLIAKSSRVVTVVADSSKIGRISLVKYAPMSAADMLITDSGMKAKDRKAIEKARCRVVVTRNGSKNRRR
jgi:DeoR family transcriptional regulator of aga operon